MTNIVNKVRKDDKKIMSIIDSSSFVFLIIFRKTNLIDPIKMSKCVEIPNPI